MPREAAVSAAAMSSSANDSAVRLSVAFRIVAETYSFAMVLLLHLARTAGATLHGLGLGLGVRVDRHRLWRWLGLGDLD